jgi:hypothetical protein
MSSGPSAGQVLTAVAAATAAAIGIYAYAQLKAEKAAESKSAAAEESGAGKHKHKGQGPQHDNKHAHSTVPEEYKFPVKVEGRCSTIDPAGWLDDAQRVNIAMFAENRRRLIQRFKDRRARVPGASCRCASPAEAIVVAGGTPMHRYDTDADYVFRQESNFTYLFAVPEPDMFGAINLETEVYTPHTTRTGEPSAASDSPPLVHCVMCAAFDPVHSRAGPRAVRCLVRSREADALVR